MDLLRVVVLILLSLFPATSCALAQEDHNFVHPGIIETQEELDQIKRIVATQPDHPATSYYQKMKLWEGARYEYEHRALETVTVKAGGVVEEELRFRKDAQAAYACALQWVITEDPRYMSKSKQILNDWAENFTHMKTVRGRETVDQLVVEAGWVTPIWVAAAEIIRHYDQGAAQWGETEIRRFSQFLDKLWEEFGKLYYGLLPKRVVQYRCNWGTSAALSMISVAVFQDDVERYRDAISYCQEILPLNVEQNGEIFETCRDCYHPGYALNTLIQAAEIVHHQGDDLYGMKFDGQPKPRLWYGLEYRARRVMGLSNPAPVCYGPYNNYQADCSKCRQCWYESGWELGVNHYRSRMGIDCDNAAMLIRKVRQMDFFFDEHFIAFGTLTHGSRRGVSRELRRPEAR